MSMDAVDFINTRDRMVKETGYAPAVEYTHAMPAEEIVAVVEKWAREHPVKTRQKLFLEQWPNAELDCCNIIKIDPCDVDATIYQNCNTDACEQCRREFWSQEVD